VEVHGSIPRPQGIARGAAWATFATILLSLACSVFGGIVGCLGDRRPREYIERRAPLGPTEPVV